jgi:ABC-type uncharacterized transport system substrate-binding protein
VLVDLARNRRAAVIFAFGGPSPALAANSATATIPVVFANGVDPVGVGLVAIFSQPRLEEVTGERSDSFGKAGERDDVCFRREVIPTWT